jgi:hypothetical protein
LHRANSYAVVGMALTAWVIVFGDIGAARNPPDARGEYAAIVRPLVEKYCLSCHSAKLKKGSLDLERFATIEDIRKDLKVCQQTIEMLTADEMPPAGKPQPTADERKALLNWTRNFLDAEARARAGDPGHVPLRRLSNAEYDYTIRDLTGVDLRPTREFPADGAAGEGFTNAAEALTDISPALLTKYLNAAKDIADHVVFLPDGIRFSPAKTRRDWTNECVAKLRGEYAPFGPDGKLPLSPYLAATVRHRDALLAGTVTLETVAAREKLNATYLGVLWRTLTDQAASQPLDAIRAKWRTATEKDVPALAAGIAAWQATLWKTVKVGNYIQASWNSPDNYVESLTRQMPVDPRAVESAPLRITVKPTPGQSDVVLYLAAREVGSGGGPVVWQRPRIEAPGQPPLLLRDYAKFGPTFEIDYPTAFADTAKYLAAGVEAANDRALKIDELAKSHGLDAGFLKRWAEVLAVEPYRKDGAEAVGRIVPAVPLTLLEEKTQPDPARPAVNGWRKAGTDLPVLVTNASDKPEQIPGRIPAHGVGVHPMPTEFVAAVWRSPVAGRVTVAATVVHAHPVCGNGVAWWLEHRRGARAHLIAEGAVDLGGEGRVPAKTLAVEPGDEIILAVDAKDNNHSCDMTAIDFILTDAGMPGHVWDLAKDVSGSIHDGNPHADRQGHRDVWSFVRGPSRPLGSGLHATMPPTSLLGKWREAAADPNRKAEAAELAGEVQRLLTGKRPADAKSPDRVAFDALVAADGALFKGLDLARLGKRGGVTFGLPAERFGTPDDASFTAPTGAVTEVRLPAALFVGREFAVDGKLDDAGDRVVQFQVSTAKPGPDARWDGKTPVVASNAGAAYQRLVAGFGEFRRVFPLYVCFPPVVPADEVVTLKMFHREDEPLARLFLDDGRVRRLDRLWAELRFVSRQPVAEFAYLPQFMGFTTQDTPKAFQQFFVDRKPLFKQHADEFLKDESAANPRHLDALLACAAKAYRRPLDEHEAAELLALYGTLQKKGAPHDEAVRGVLARILVAPAFLFRIERAPPGKDAGPVSDWELATRLSYFLWASTPDDELRSLAAAGRLRDPQILAVQTRRMLKDARVRGLAVGFGTQWIHVRGFDQFNEKNETLFPTFTADLRKAIDEESVLFFQGLFQDDGTVTQILDADHTYLNELLAKHYAIPGIVGPNWRRVDGVRKYGRGGLLGLASVLATQSGASRTSPVLRGNWVVETLLGEKLPRPPASVPKLPEDEGGSDGLTTRQRVEKHVNAPECAVCHVRIDPYGFALEAFDPIGRRRDHDLGGHPVDTHSTLKDGTKFTDIDGLRNYLLTTKRDVFVRLVCRKLLGYALGRSVALSDTVLIDQMVAEMDRNDGRLSAAVLAIVRSPQFRMVRGSGFTE